MAERNIGDGVVVGSQEWLVMRFEERRFLREAVPAVRRVFGGFTLMGGETSEVMWECVARMLISCDEKSRDGKKYDRTGLNSLLHRTTEDLDLELDEPEGIAMGNVFDTLVMELFGWY